MTVRSIMAGLLGGLAIVSFAAPAQAQEFPSRDITLVVGFPAGGSTDLMARVIADEMSKVLGQRVAVENRAGANAATATRAVARGAADGYTMLFNASNMAANLSAMKDPGYTWKDFAIVGGLAYAPFIMVVNTASSKAKDLKEFVEFGKANPGKLTYGSLGPSSPPNLVAQRLNSLSKVGYREVPYKGAAQVSQDLLSGNVDVYFGLPSTGTTLLGQPNIAVFGIADKKRSALLPNTPTFTESGYAAIDDVSVAGIWVPSGTPKPVVDKLRKAMADAMKTKETKAALDKAGQFLYERSPEQFQAEIEKATAVFKTDFDKLGIKPE